MTLCGWYLRTGFPGELMNVAGKLEREPEGHQAEHWMVFSSQLQAGRSLRGSL